MNKILTQCLTGKDNKTHDVIRWLTMVSVLAGIALQTYHTIMTGEFDLQQFGIGNAGLLSGAGAALKLKENTEPGL
jgi:hypothetical protein